MQPSGGVCRAFESESIVGAHALNQQMGGMAALRTHKRASQSARIDRARRTEIDKDMYTATDGQTVSESDGWAGC